MFATISGVVLILGGLVWLFLVYLAAGMGDRAPALSDYLPALLSLAAIIGGVALLVWG